jgi:hypothetical protein
MSWVYYGDDGKKYFEGTGTPYGTTFKTGDVIGCNVHLEGNIFFTLNGASLVSMTIPYYTTEPC